MAKSSDGTPQPRSGSPLTRLLRAHWGTLVLLVLVVIFVAENRSQVSIDLLVVHVRAWLWLVLAVTAGLGVLIGLLLGRRREK